MPPPTDRQVPRFASTAQLQMPRPGDPDLDEDDDEDDEEFETGEPDPNDDDEDDDDPIEGCRLCAQSRPRRSPVAPPRTCAG